MKLDYKPQDVEMGSFQKRHLIRVLLGSVAVLCLSLTFLKSPAAPDTANANAAHSGKNQILASAKQAGSTTTTPSSTSTNSSSTNSSVNKNTTSKNNQAKDQTKDQKDQSKDKSTYDAKGSQAKDTQAKDTQAKNDSKSKKSASETLASRIELARASDTTPPSVNKNSTNKDSTKDSTKNLTTNKETAETTAKDEPKEESKEEAKEDGKQAEAATGTNSKLSNQEWDIVKVQKGDTLAKIFKRQGYSQKDLEAIMGADPKSKKQLIALKTGQDLRLHADAQKQLQGLSLDVGKDQVLYITKHDKQDNKEAGFSAEYKSQPIEKQIAFGKGKVNSSLSLAGKRAGLDQHIISQMVEIFGWNIDFSTDLQPNDTFRVLFEEKRVEGEKIGTGNILAAEIVSKGKKHLAVRYTDKAGHTGYFSPDGQGLRQAFLRYPVEFTRISSGFGNRCHPKFHKMRKHTGVDLAAPRGTPVKTTGDGKVIFVGTRGGYGRVVEIQHGPQYSTLYAHLSKFAPKIKAGSNVKQGDIIGNVGRTGLATGDHLHYEFRVGGIHRDPLTIALPRKNPITDGNKRQFLAHAKEMLRLMDIHENKVNVVQNEYHEDE